MAAAFYHNTEIICLFLFADREFYILQEVIAYLLPSGLHNKKARPLMEVSLYIKGVTTRLSDI